MSQKDAGKLGQPSDVDVEVSFSSSGCEASGVNFLPNCSSCLFEDVAPCIYNAAVPVIATRTAWTAYGMVCFQGMAAALLSGGVPVHAMGRGVGGEAEAPTECSAEGVVAVVGALVGQRRGEAAASSEAGCTAEADGVSWGRGGEEGRVKMRACMELKVGLEVAERYVWTKLVWWGKLAGVGGWSAAWALC